MPAWFEFAFLGIALTLLTPVLGGYMAAVFTGGDNAATWFGRPVERMIYRVCRIDGADMSWRRYLAAIVWFTAVPIVAVFLSLIVQQLLPFNPQHFAGIAPLLALNIAISFVTTTNWQAYPGESTLGALTQMAGLAWLNFVAAATGIAVAIAAIRGFTRANATTIGNFWVDCTRALLYVLLPLAFVGALAFVWQGVPQNLHPYVDVKSVEGATQTLVNGPIASQTIIEQLGVNGGGYAAANVASPNLNPTPLTDLLGVLAMLVIGAALTNTFGRLVGNVRQGWTLYIVMFALFTAGFAGIWASEHHGNPAVHQLGIAGPNLEGKELRFGDTASALSITAATDTSSGAANVAYDSLMPLSVLLVLLNMQVGEIIFGGAGSGLYGMLLLVLLTVFIAGLMVGRSPEYLGKKIDTREITLVVIATLIPAFSTLVPTALALIPHVSATGNTGPRGFTEILYAFTSVQANNGSALGGLTITTDLYNVLTAIVMLIGRFGTLIVILAIAGSFARKPRNEQTRGTLDTTTPLFATLVAATSLVVTAVTYIPADALGPVAEALALQQQTLF